MTKKRSQMVMTKFEKLLDNLDATYVEHNKFFEKHVKYSNGDNQEFRELAELDSRIMAAHKEVSDAIRAANGDGRKFSDLATERAKARPGKMTRWLDPKVVREEARKHASQMKHSVFNGLSINELEEHRKAARKRQKLIDAQGGKCVRCGEPLDIWQQTMGGKGRIICDTCVIEEMSYPSHIIL